MPLNVAQVTLVLYITGRSSSDKSSSLKPHVSGYLVHDWYCHNTFVDIHVFVIPQTVVLDLYLFFYLGKSKTKEESIVRCMI